jgi:hypothetical protein
MSVDAQQRLSLRQADHARGDLYALQDELDFLKAGIARVPTRTDLATDNLTHLLHHRYHGESSARVSRPGFADGLARRLRSPVKRPCVPAVAMP